MAGADDEALARPGLGEQGSEEQGEAHARIV
jgi:hypothetical protein